MVGWGELRGWVGSGRGQGHLRHWPRRLVCTSAKAAFRSPIVPAFAGANCSNMTDTIEKWLAAMSHRLMACAGRDEGRIARVGRRQGCAGQHS